MDAARTRVTRGARAGAPGCRGARTGLDIDGCFACRHHRWDAGVRVIVSSLTGQYLAKQATWDTIFTEEIMPPGLTAAEQKYVLGGATAMWGETMDDSDIDTIVWPDTCAAAERLWSPPQSESHPDAFDVAGAKMRLIPHRCRMYPCVP